jgi:hypothetical protein
MPQFGQTKWDQTAASRLYDEGKAFTEIGHHVGVRGNVIGAFAARHWPRREVMRNEGPRRPAHRPDRTKLRPLPRGEPTLPPLPSLIDDR